MKKVGKILAALITAYSVYFVAVFGFYAIRHQLRGSPTKAAAINSLASSQATSR